ncbi:multiple epidermal growth factor domains protein 6, partial [Biomphalaria glabrata]
MTSDDKKKQAVPGTTPPYPQGCQLPVRSNEEDTEINGRSVSTEFSIEFHRRFFISPSPKECLYSGALTGNLHENNNRINIVCTYTASPATTISNYILSRLTMTCCGFETWAEVSLGLILTIVLKAQLATAVDGFNPTISTHCPEGWTGPKCDYKCLCSMEKCNEYSECQDSVSCLENYFGPACQYVNIVPNSIEHTGPILDQLETTCTSMSNGSSQSVQFERPQAFTFLRLFLEDLSKMTSVDVQFSGGDFKTKRSCETFSYMYISSTTMDVHCYTSELYTEVEVIWYGDVDVCGIYISGGRNLVARSSANSSSSDADQTADKAVDSHTPSNTICFHSSANDTDPRFSVSLTGMVRIHKVILYGCDDCEMNVSSGPNHLSLKENSTSLQAHQQEWNLLLHLVSPTISMKSKSVDLTLCEIVVLG